jgi:hypothetical protein
MPDDRLLSVNGVTPPGRGLVRINIEDNLSAQVHFIALPA